MELPRLTRRRVSRRFRVQPPIESPIEQRIKWQTHAECRVSNRQTAAADRRVSRRFGVKPPIAECRATTDRSARRSVAPRTTAL